MSARTTPRTYVVASPYGCIELTIRNGKIEELGEAATEQPTADSGIAPEDRAIVSNFSRECETLDFTVPVAEPSGTPFQQAVLRAIAAIPRGSTASYAQIAKDVGHPGAARAVGNAVARNPLPLIIPCHRVVGSSSLGGYSFGGKARKETLLALEGARQS